MTRSQIIDITMHLHVETERAILASDDGDKDHAVWFPLSQVEITRARKPSYIIVSMPEWLAVEKGLV